ncbi:MAG: C69 family dipeptidase [Acidobacteria bacterium]|nr:C69 family dipeptidase [Acidobacteriota bacterium]
MFPIHRFFLTVIILGLLAATAPWLSACSSLLVSKGASSDGSVIITYACDGEFHPHLTYQPAADHGPDEGVEISRRGEVKGTIPQVPHTYAVYGLINEHQLAIGETTFDGRKELQSRVGLLHYWTLMRLALQRARTAREAIRVMTELVEQHGYASTGETFSIADPHEAWIMEMIGPGPDAIGAIWVARRVPDGFVCAHANASRIGEFPLDDPANCLYSPNIISFAVEQGFYDPDSGEPFRFNRTYHPMTPQSLRYTATRVWSFFRRMAPSQVFPPDYHRGVEGAEPYPLWIRPDQKLGVADVMALMRDHYEGTPYDMTQGVDAGPFGSPNRWRPMSWTMDDTDYTWERPISTQQTGFSFISQSRAWLPDEIGGVYWYGVDDTYTTCYIPFYCCCTEVPPSLATGRLSEFSWDSAWWVFNFVANFANLKYSYMIKDIQAVQQAQEQEFVTRQPAVEKTAQALLEQDRAAAMRYLTDYSLSHTALVTERWRALGEYLITRYNDGYVQDENHRPREVGYPDSWLKNVLQLRPDQFRLPRWGKDKLEKDLPY